MNADLLLEEYIMLYQELMIKENEDLQIEIEKLKKLVQDEVKMRLSKEEKEAMDRMKQAIYCICPSIAQIMKEFHTMIDDLNCTNKSKIFTISSSEGGDENNLKTVCYANHASSYYGDCKAFLDGILVLVDPQSHRLILKHEPEIDLSECLTSEKPGGLFLFENAIVWTTSKILTQSSEHVWNLNCPTIQVMFPDVDFYSLDIHRSSSSSITKRAKSFVLTIHSKQESLAIYPIMAQDLKQLLRVLIKILSQPPSQPESIVKNILTQKLNLVRLLAVSHLLEQEHPWIEKYHDLKDVINRLISPDASLYELERLFHSCKREKAVLSEAISIIQSSWHRSSDLAKIRILALVDRILEPVLVTPSTEVYSNIFKWLGMLEETLNPFKHGDLVTCVGVMLDRMRQMHGKLWPAKDNYDLFSEFQLYSGEYREYQTRGLWK